MKERITRSIIAILLVTVLLISNSAILGMEIISYALDVINATNEENVQFTAYFKDKDGNMVTNKSEFINADNMKLYAEIAVKKQGYFNGEIEITDSNFELKGKEYGTEVKKVEGNKIFLNQINAGSTVILELDIKPVIDEKYKVDNLNKISQIKISGIYRDSDEKDKQINATREVNLNFLSPYTNQEEKYTHLTANATTNKVYEIDGLNKRMVQYEITSGLNENLYPIKSTCLKLTLPQNAESYEILRRGILATNGDAKNTLLESGITYNQETKELNITIENTPNGENKIYWNKSGKDKIIVTLILGEDDTLQETTINQEIKLYDDTIFTDKITVLAENEVDGIINYEIGADNEIFKGNLYAGIEKEIKTVSKVDIRYKNIANTITVTGGTAKYKVAGTEKLTTLKYKSSSINKEKLIEVLGTTGTLTIKDVEGNILSTINSQTQANENGIITINYNENLSNLIIEITEPENAGVIEIEHTRVIIENTYTKEEIRTFETLELEGKSQANKNIESKSVNKVITLQETITEAKLQINKETLSTTQTNEDVEILAILKSDGEQYDLYKNPNIHIEFPSEVANIDIKSLKVVSTNNEFTGKGKLNKNETGNFILDIGLTGEQANYVDQAREGVLIKIKANITLNLDTPTKETEIKMTYTNENAIQEIYNTKVNVKLESLYGLLTYAKVSGFNSKNEVVESINGNDLIATMDAGANNRIANIQYKLINNYETELKNVEIIGSLAIENKDKNTFTTVLENINVSRQDATIYYTKDDMLSESNISQATGYKIVINEISAGEIININVDVNLPDEISYGEYAEILSKVNYIYNGQENSKVQKVQLQAEQLSINLENGETVELRSPTVTTSESGVTVAISATTQGEVLDNGDIKALELKESETVKEGQMITYYATIKNNTGKDLTNIQVVARHENANIWGIVADIDANGMDYTEYRNVGNTSTLETLESLASGESKTIKWYAIVSEDAAESATTFGILTMTAEGIETQEFKTQENEIKQAQLSTMIEYLVNEEAKTYSDSYLRAGIVIKSLSDSDLENVKLTINTVNLKNEKKNIFSDNEFIENPLEYTVEEINENSVVIMIPKISAGETKELIFTPAIKDFSVETETLPLKVIAKAETKNNSYITNLFEKDAYQNEAYFETVLSSSIEPTEKKLEDGDKVTFTMEITNKSLYVNGAGFMNFELGKGFAVDKVTVVKNDVQIDETEYVYKNKFSEQVDLDVQESEKITVEAHVDYSLFDTNEITAKFSFRGQEYTKVYKIKTIVDNDSPEEPGKDDDNDNTTNKISGIVWIDENRNGVRETGEAVLSGIKVYAFNINTNSYVESTVTAQDGTYKFNLAKGKYAVVFEYDSTKYMPTEFESPNATDLTNSDAISKTITVNNKEIIAAITNEIELSGNKSNIDLGLTEKKTFDLELSKYINKIIVQNSAGTKTYEYKKSTNAKVEIKSKHLVGSNIVIEYGIKVKNTGDLAGYVYSIVDYLPDGLEFSSELNTDWYKVDENLYNISLQNIEIKPGEEKEITLTLTKKMTNNNVGLVNNMAEIFLDQNDLGLEDIDSTAGNKIKGEDDLGSADVIIAISTGGLQIYIVSGLIAIICALAIVAAYFIRKEVIKERR